MSPRAGSKSHVRTKHVTTNFSMLSKLSRQEFPNWRDKRATVSFFFENISNPAVERMNQLTMTMTMTMTMTHSEKSLIYQMKAWPYRQECRGHGPTKKYLFLLVYLARLTSSASTNCWRTDCIATVPEMDSMYKEKTNMNHRQLLC